MKRARKIRKRFIKIIPDTDGWLVGLEVGEDRFILGTPWRSKLWAETKAKELARALDALVEECL